MEGVEENRVSVITQHIDTKRFTPGKVINQSNNLTILFTGRLEFYKGVYEVIYSAKRLLSDPQLSRFNLRFVLVGDGTEKKKLLELVERLGISQSVEFQSVSYRHMPKIYHCADIFVAPARAIKTYQEQFCTTLLEAQASGLAIVTTACGGIRENVGDAALLAIQGDFYSVAAALKRFILFPKLRKTYGQKARQRATKRFDIGLGAKKLENVYKSVL